jgi:hypothetical protein
MTEENKKKEKLIINIVDGIPCIYLPQGIIGKKLPPPVVIPFHFGAMQEHRERSGMPDILKEIKKMFEGSKFGVSYFELPGPKKKEDKNDNEERERKTEKSI